MLQKLLGLLNVKKLIVNVGAAAATGIGGYLALCGQTGQPVTKTGLIGAVSVAVGANVFGLFQEKPRSTQTTRAEDGYDPDAVDKAIERAKVQAQTELEKRKADVAPVPQTPGTFGR